MNSGMYTKKKVYPIILSGGSGTRLWPLSRSNMPKQFIKLLMTVHSTNWSIRSKQTF